MQEVLRWLASWKDIPVEKGSELRFELSGFPSGGLGLLIILGALFAFFLVGFIYRRDGKNLSTGQRVVLATLRVLAVLAALLVILEPNLIAIKKDVRDGHAIILLDLSQSMGHKDAFRRAEVQELVAGWSKLGHKDLPATTRLELAKSVLAQDDYALIRKLNEKNKVLIYGFSTGLEPIPLAEVKPELDAEGNPIEPETRIAPLPKLDEVQANGKYSNLGAAVRGALRNSRAATVAAVVLLSDGRRNMGSKAAELSRYLSQRKVGKTMVLGIGDPSEAQLVSVARIEAPDRAFQKDPFKIRAFVDSQGYDALSLNVRLLQVPEGGGQGTVVQQQTLQLGANEQGKVVEFENLVADAPGLRTYRVEIDPPEGEPLNPERHGKQARVTILDEQTKVLLIAGSPMHEYQILRQLLTRDRTIELSCWLLSADDNFLQDGNKNLERLPEERKELEPYDVFIVMDPDPNMLDREFCEMMARQVEENGAGLWWICGEKYSVDAMEVSATTEPLAQILPIVPNMELAKQILIGGRGFARPFPYELTPAGKNHQITRVKDVGRDENALLWSQLPGWHMVFPVERPKPGATVLIETSASSRFREGTEPMPVVASQFYGAGRVLYTGTDELYRWRGHYEEAYDRFWVKGVRHLFEGRLTAGSARLRIDISGQKLELGEPLQVSVEAKDSTYRPLIADSFSLQLQRENEPPVAIDLKPVESAPGQFETTLRRELGKTGFYRLSWGSGTDRVESEFQVIAAAVEKEGPMDINELGAIAEAREGVLLKTPEELLAAADEVRSGRTTETFRTPHAVWDGWPTVAVILLLLSIEWWLRKRWNLL